MWVVCSRRSTGSAGPYHLHLLDLARTGLVVPYFKPPAINGGITSMDISGGRLFLGGYFTKVGNQSHGGLATLKAATGALDPFMGIRLAGHHVNTTGSGDQTSVGARSLDVTADGSRLVVVGNFTTADGRRGCRW